MKKILCLIISLIIVCSAIPAVSAANIGDIIGYTCYTDIVASINNYNIASYNINGYTGIVAEDLRNYGFDVQWIPETRSLYIRRGITNNVASTYIAPEIPEYMVGMKAFDILYTDIRCYINGSPVSSYNIDGRTIINFNDLAAFGAVSYDNTTRRLDLDISDGLSYKNIAYNANGVKITYIGYKYDDFWEEYSFTFLIENNTSSALYFDGMDVAIDGYMTYGYLLCNIPAGKKSYETLDLSADELYKNGTDLFRTIELAFEVTDANTFDTLFTTNTVVITPTGIQNSQPAISAAQSYGHLKGKITYTEYESSVVCNDNEAVIMIIPKNNNVKNYNNTSAAMLVPGKYDSGIMVTTCDSSGNYDFGQQVPAGDYYMLIVSGKTTDGLRILFESSWTEVMTGMLSPYFSDSDLDMLLIFIGHQAVSTGDITVTKNQVKNISHKFVDVFAIE